MLATPAITGLDDADDLSVEVCFRHVVCGWIKAAEPPPPPAPLTDKPFRVAVTREISGAQGAVQALIGGSSEVVLPAVTGSTSVGALKDMIAEKTSRLREQLQLQLAGEVLDDDERVLHDYGCPHWLVIASGDDVADKGSESLPSLTATCLDIHIELSIGLPRLRLSDLFSETSLTKTEILIDLGKVTVRHDATMDSRDAAATGMRRRPCDAFVVSTKSVDGGLGPSIGLRRTVAALAAQISPSSLRFVSSTVLANFLHDGGMPAVGLPEEETELGLAALGAWLSGEPQLKDQLLNSEMLAPMEISTRLEQTFLPASAVVRREGIEPTRFQVECAGLHLKIDMLDITVLKAVTGKVFLAKKIIDNEVGASDPPLLQMQDNPIESAAELMKTAPVNAERTEEELLRFASGGDGSASGAPTAVAGSTENDGKNGGDLAVVASGFTFHLSSPTTDFIDFAFTVSRNQRPAIQLWSSLQLRDCRRSQVLLATYSCKQW